MNNWQTRKLGEICEKVESGEWGEKQEKGNFIPCRVIKGTDFLLVQNRDFSKIPIRFVEKTKLEKLKLHYSDILIEISGGSREQTTGRILFWDKFPFLQGKAELGEIYPAPKIWCSNPIKIVEKGDILISVRAPVGDVNLADQNIILVED